MRQLLLVVGLMSFGVLGGCSDRNQTKWRPTDRLLIEKAIKIYSGNGKIPREKVLKEVDPVVVYLPQMTCVGLNLKPGGAGGDTTICFDRGGKEVLHFVNGD